MFEKYTGDIMADQCLGNDHLRVMMEKTNEFLLEDSVVPVKGTQPQNEINLHREGN